MLRTYSVYVVMFVRKSEVVRFHLETG